MELLDKKETAIAAYQPFYADLAKLEEDNASITFDYESKKGNTEARSHVYKLRQSKGALERTRKAEKAEFLRLGKAVDSEAAALEQRIEAMIKVHQDAIDAIEKREVARIAELQTRVDALTSAVPMLETIGSEDLAAGISELELVAIDDTFMEFAAPAAKAKDARLMHLRQHLVTVKAKEAEAIELARLRREAAERAQADRDAAIAKAAAERVQSEAAAAATRAAAAAAQAIADAEAKAKAEREAGERRELELKLAAENAERRRVEQEQRAEQERTEAIARAERAEQDAKDRAERQAKEASAAAERQAAEAVEREQKRVAAVAAQEAKELAAREANKVHKARINRAALAALVAGGLSEECAKQCVTLIASGKVPAITIAY